MDNSQITVRPVRFGSADYQKMVDCRNAVLRIPMGRILTPEELARDEGRDHYAAFTSHGHVVGTVVLDSLSPTQVRARQVAVRSEVRGQGVGAMLMRHAEAEARHMGFREIILHARETAVPFYERMGYEAEGEYFEESWLPHILMRKWL